MAETKWVPRPGEVISLDADPLAKGHEQGGIRRHVVLTRQGVNDKVGLLACVPITTKIKGYPGEVPISQATANGKPAVALAFQVFTVDWRARDAGTYGYFASAGEMKRHPRFPESLSLDHVAALIIAVRAHIHWTTSSLSARSGSD